MTTTENAEQVAMPDLTEPVSIRAPRVTCEAHAGQTLYGFEVIDANRADAILHKGRFLFGIVTDRGGKYLLLTQRNDTWRVPRTECRAVAFNLLPEYRATLEQDVYPFANNDIENATGLESAETLAKP